MNAFHGSDCEDDNAGLSGAFHNVKNHPAAMLKNAQVTYSALEWDEPDSGPAFVFSHEPSFNVPVSMQRAASRSVRWVT